MPVAQVRSQTANSGLHLRHRADIDGLRAIAILAVLVFHAWPEALPGGFVGVDVFFVISGFLISSIIFKGLAHNTFSFIDFYARRIKRIFPALALMLVAVLAVGWYALLTDEFAQLGKHVAAGAGFVSNVVLWREAGYFDRDAALKPLLHLWSLGIEEQFYLGWPLLAFLAWKWRINLLAVIVVVGLTSFLLNVAFVATNESATFYLPITRIWELAVGSLLAYGQTFKPQQLEAVQRAAKNPLAVAGAALLAAAIGLLDSYRLFPGWWGLLPTLGMFLLIAAGPEAWINRKILAARPMVFIGLISYPLYLWHWPLFSFQRIVGPEPGTAVKGLTLAVAFLLAWLTYRFVETPVRSGRAGRRIAPALAVTTIAVGVGGYLVFASILLPRSANFDLDRIIEASNSIAYPGPRLQPFGPGPTQLRKQGQHPQSVLFLGDSTIEQYYPRIDWLLTERSVQKSVVFAASGSCPPIPHVRDDHRPHCDGLVERALDYARDGGVDTVVIGANWIQYFEQYPENQYYFVDHGAHLALSGNAEGVRQSLASLQNMMGSLIAEGKRVYLILQGPTGTYVDPRVMIKRTWSDMRFEIQPPTVQKRQLSEAFAYFVSPLRAVAAEVGAVVIDPVEQLCADATCALFTADGEPVYKDHAHLNPAYVRKYVQYLDPVLSGPVRTETVRLRESGEYQPLL